MSDTILDTNVKPNDATPSTTMQPTPTINVEELLAKVRAEEKGKLYPEIEKLKTEVNTKVERINSLLMSVAEKDEQNKALTKELEQLKTQLEEVKEEGAKSKVDNKELKELKDKITALEKEMAEKEAVIAQKEAEAEALKKKAEIDAYVKEKVKDLDESVQDLVFGNSKEEVDSTYDKAKSAYEKLANKLGKPNNTQTIPKPGISAHADMDAFKNMTPDQIRALGADPEKWKEFRKSINLK